MLRLLAVLFLLLYALTSKVTVASYPPKQLPPRNGSI